MVESKSVIYIPKGSTNAIVTYLNKKTYDLNIIDTTIIKTLGYPQNGWIDLKQSSMSKGDFLHKIMTSKAALKSVMLIPGETYYFFLKDVATKLKLSHQKLIQYYDEYKYKEDGNILAQTYTLPIGMDEEELIVYLFKYTNKQYTEYSHKIFGEYNQKNWFKYITIASIIQKEAASIEEMSLVSSVIYNRLKKDMRLQMDGTLNYGKFSHTKVTPKMIKEDTSTYNTYKNKGIPSNPICAVEFNAIKGAIFPKNTKYLYFMKAVDGSKHIFSTTYSSHKRAIRNVIKAKRKVSKKKRIQKKKVTKAIKSTTTNKTVKREPKKQNIKSIWDNIK